MHDWKNDYIKPGTKVLYSTRHSSSMTQNIAIVKEVVVKDHPYRRGLKEEKARVEVIASSSKWEKLPRNVMVSTANLTVIGEA